MLGTGISGKLKRALTENIHLKALSLAIAVILWGIVSGERNTERAYLVPLEIKGKPQDLIITSNIPNFLDVRIQGARSFIMGLNPEDMAVQLDLSGLEVGRSIFPITPDKMKVPRGVKVTRINPSYVMLDVERLMQKTVKIKPEIRGKPAENFAVAAVEVTPTTVEIMGPESEVKGIAVLSTGTVDITGARKDVTREVPVDILGRKISLSTETPVTVTVRIREVTARLELKRIAVKVLDGKPGVAVKPAHVSLLMEGPKSVIEGLRKTKAVEVTVDAGKLEPGTYRKPVALDLPEGVRVLYLTPREVTLEIEDDQHK